MTYGIIANGIVANIAEASPEFAAEQGWVELPEGAGIGWRYEGGEEWEPPVVEAPPVVLLSLTRRQLRLALLSIEVTAADVEAVIADIVDPTERAAALIEWEDASSYERDHPLIADVAEAMELPPEQVDALWLWAAEL